MIIVESDKNSYENEGTMSQRWVNIGMKVRLRGVEITVVYLKVEAK
jgi:hypothetical protein